MLELSYLECRLKQHANTDASGANIQNYLGNCGSGWNVNEGAKDGTF